MTADGDPVSSSSENGVSPHITWIELRTLWERLWQAGLPSRFVLHGCFLAMLLAGIWLSKAVIFPQHLFSLPTLAAQMAVEGKSVSFGVVYASLGVVSPGGIGGEEADVLVSAVVPHTTIPRRYRIDPITYTVEPGDNVSIIAEKFGVSVETILWANGNLEDNPDYLQVGDKLIILPVSGVYHTVAKGDTLESIAQKYKVRVEDITSYEGNYMQEPYTITVGQKLIVPGGRKPYQVRHVVAWSGSVPQGAKRGTGVFGWPVSGYITQRYSEVHPAVDIGVPEGTPVKAADSGYVAVVGRSDTGYGRYVLIDHGNGFQTVYAHLSVIYVEVGQSVGKGQTIGLSGNTGKSTGPHLHFEIKLNGVRRNPFIYLK
ncbi:MAG: peptidoglycan DD-metalloendopeptidase family protein [Anaerolineae bacterium]